MDYHGILQKAIDYIEDHLHEPLTLESVASYAGFSKYHFHRVFQKETGMTVSDYVRLRRLASAASMLLYTDESIIDIATHFRFEAQESFTRAFKKVYQMPPGQYRRILSAMIHKNGGKDMQQQPKMKGWFLSGSHPFHYEMGTDTKEVHQGKRSGYLKSVTVQSADEFATMMQQFKADKFLGKRVKLSAFVKTKNVEGFCGLWMRVDNALHDVLQFDNMSNRPIVKDTHWNLYSIVLDVPDNSALISFGVLLAGKGQVWVDQFQFEEVDKSVPTTHLEITHNVLDEPVNLTFEED